MVRLLTPFLLKDAFMLVAMPTRLCPLPGKTLEHIFLDKWMDLREMLSDDNTQSYAVMFPTQWPSSQANEKTSLAAYTQCFVTSFLETYS